METDGLFAPETAAEASAQFETLAPAASEVVRAVAKEMSFDTGEYDDRVTGEVIETAREALYASLLEVRIGDREEYHQWCDDHECEPVEVGSQDVDRVVWHAAPFAETAVAATFQEEREAAVATLRRQAFGRLYADVLEVSP
ncbi:hypothetical protein SAMN05216226_101103 [Halovenus aranensis]|jgi:hypothetical protein|uniref:Uncharacterized protein n=1 Tax=Halovenus aranensis TaxID=890420 RepID=A0A1G8RSP9_9EURY|nr:DUF5809 family protein [Halovenus aranensis]SDJ20084.1 hypothetical protein SAMN05216226_101103 [Halovenus aranensis]